MGIHASKGKSLLCTLACLFERVVLKSAVVAMIVCDFYTVVSDGSKARLALIVLTEDDLHQMDESDSGEMVDEESLPVI